MILQRRPLMRTRTLLSAAAILVLAMIGPGAAQPETAKQPAKAPDKSKTLGSLYPLSTCPISGEKLGGMGEPIVKEYDGREVRFCCKSCPPKFEKDLAASLATLDAAIVKDQAPLYPL